MSQTYQNHASIRLLKTRKRLPSWEDLPDQDDRPVDSEVQFLIANLLKLIIAYIWADRKDWFLGMDMGWYYDPEESAIAHFCQIHGPLARLSFGRWNVFCSQVIATYINQACLPTYLSGIIYYLTSLNCNYLQKNCEVDRLNYFSDFNISYLGPTNDVRITT